MNQSDTEPLRERKYIKERGVYANILGIPLREVNRAITSRYLLQVTHRFMNAFQTWL
jgi:hypothetical protein